MTSNMSLHFVLPLLLPLFSDFFVSVEAIGFNSSTPIQCLELERKALQKFRQNLTGPSGQLSSWVGKDCCKWEGIVCNTRTGNVVKLDLRCQSVAGFNRSSCRSVAGFNSSCFISQIDDPFNRSSCLGGQLSPSLLDLKYLTYLDLSMNNFQGTKIPSFFGSLGNLRYLNLSRAFFVGIVPPHLGNLSNLHYLDLSAPEYFYFNWVSDLNWLAGLSSLKYLNLGNVNLSSATDWYHAINMLASLSDLHLPNCNILNLPSSLPNLNLTSLSVLDISFNELNSSIPQWLFKINTLVHINLGYNKFRGSIADVEWEKHCNLQYLDLSGNAISGDISGLFEGLIGCRNIGLKELQLSDNHFTGYLPNFLGRLKNLRSLSISNNLIAGSIPESIGNLSFLKELDLSFNKMNGSIPGSLGKLVELTNLQLYQNSWKGVVTQNLLEGLTKLKDFSLSSSDKTFVFDVRHNWVPPFSLQYIQISDCPLGPKFPPWLSTQKELSNLVLKNVSILDTLPHWLLELSLQITQLDLSHNQISGVLPNNLQFSSIVDLSFNRFSGPIPIWPLVMYLFLGNNLFSGPIPWEFGQEMSSLRALDLSENFLNGTIPSTLCKLQGLLGLDLSKNYLSGRIPNNLKDMETLWSIDLSNNYLSGDFPVSLCSQDSLFLLKLSNNSLSGDLSLSLQNCTMLCTLDIGDNRFSGNLLELAGENLFSLSQLRMRTNMFTGNIPRQLCHLPYLHVLDLAQNNFSGSIPSCLGNLSGFISLDNNSWFSFSEQYLFPSLSYIPEMDLFVKGRQLQYTKLLDLINVIDLSSNNLFGDIPEELMNLSSLNSLNLSRNQLTGKIPEKVSQLQRLETLDLSSNYLSGPIPTSMSSMTFLSDLNLSYNNLSGPIPSTTQFSTYNPSSFEGNPELCGPPLLTECHSNTPNNGDVGGERVDGDENEDKMDTMWFYLSVGLGFTVGFWAVCGTLVIKKSWRYAYFQLLGNVRDWIFVFVAINMARARRMVEINRN